MLAEQMILAIRQRMDIDLPNFVGQEERRALAAAEEFDAMGKLKEALAKYLHARSVVAHPCMHFLVGVTCARLGLHQHAEVALRKALGILDLVGITEDTSRQRLHAATLIALSALAFQSPVRSFPELVAALQRTSKNPLFKAHQKSFVLSSLAALLSVDASKPKLAEEPALEAHKLDESNTIALHILGLVHMKRFIYARAREWLRKAVNHDPHPMHHKLLVKCIWLQFEGLEGARDKEKSTQAYLELTNLYPDSPVVSMALVMSYANSKKYYSALKESNKTLVLFLNPKPDGFRFELTDPLVVELLSVRLVCLLLHGSYATAFREMSLYTEIDHPVTAATVAVLAVCAVIIVVLSLFFGWEGSIIGTFGLVLLVLRGVLTMLLLSAVSSMYQSLIEEPFPVPDALSVI
ncbi:hypothetical protein DIPPA_06009 [Diplonema papillatum]|nr:hypothetical protein DIPPA_06009 [Diplonema papillatum]